MVAATRELKTRVISFGGKGGEKKTLNFEQTWAPGTNINTACLNICRIKANESSRGAARGKKNILVTQTNNPARFSSLSLSPSLSLFLSEQN